LPSRIVFVPSAPFLLLDDGPPELRDAITTALALLTGEVVVVGAAPTQGWVEGTADLTPYGVRGAPASDPLPLALAVGSHLLAERAHRLWGVPSGPLPVVDTLLVVADGTATRTPKAPGYYDERAEAFDGAVVAALAAGDPSALAALDEDLATQLMVAGLPAWRAVASMPGPWRGAVTYADAPYGVGYVVATWTR
jgi:hypothetical protein